MPEFFKSINTKMWLLTGDNKELALNCSVEIGLINEKTDTRFELKLPEENIVKEMRRAIALIKDIYIKN